jgi:hypothetical protein
MRKLIFVALVVLLVSINAAAQDPKPWTEWSKTEAEKMLNDSPWGQTHAYKRSIATSNSAQPRRTAAPPTGIYGPAGTNAIDDGNAMKSVLMGGVPSTPTTSSSSLSVNYTFRIRFLSAKPIREAFAAMFLIKQAGIDSADREKAVESLKSFVELESANYIVVAVESVDFAALPQDLSTPLKDNTYLQRRDGKRVSLINYRAAGPDGLGAQFLFPRSLEDQPFLNLDSGEVRLHSEIGPNFKLDRVFKISNMVYRGKLEY